jgi:prepilin signal peptidase PulO-like enzyme (type II secretory pathway)
VWTFAQIADTIVGGGLALTLVWVAVTDLRAYRIPDLASLGLLATGLALSATSPWVTPVEAVWGAALGFGVFALLGEAYFRLRGVDGLGLGDAKLMAAAGAWLGWQALPHVILISSTSALAFAWLTGQRKIAFGVWISLAFFGLWLTQAMR